MTFASLCRRILGMLPLLWCVVAAAEGAREKVRPVRLATHDQAPYGSYQADNHFDGIAVKVIRCVFKRMGRDLVIEVFPWERAQRLAESGAQDGFFPATMKKERLLWAEASTTIADQKWVWYLKADSKLDPSAPNFKQTAKVGAHFGSNRLKMLIENQFDVTVKPPSDELLLLAFIAGRADAILAGDQAIAEAMQKNDIDPKLFKMIVMQDSPLLAYFARSFLAAEPGFMKEFNRHIPACRKP